MTGLVEQARATFARQEWGEALSAFADIEPAALNAADWERTAVCAYLVGDDEASNRAWEQAHRTSVEAGEPAEAARRSFWLAMCLMLGDQMAQAGAWLSRTERLIGEEAPDCAATGYILIPSLLGALDAGDPEAALSIAQQAVDIGHAFDDADLGALATLGRGQALVAAGDTTAGKASLDEVMLSVTGGDVGPITTGIVYCAVILECMQLFDTRRASEWTRALSSWCEAQPDLVPYRGQCMVHRSQLAQAAGAWTEATADAAAACDRLADPPHPALGLAHYQQAELRRLVGEFDDAGVGYRAASRNGYEPMPGLALLEAARGDSAGAAAIIERSLQEPGPALQRPSLLFAAVQIHRLGHDLPGARAASEELTAIAAESDSEVLGAMAAEANGAVLVMEDSPSEALAELRRARSAWHALGRPYEGARVTALVALSCSALGDETTASLEIANALQTFATLGATPDHDRLAGSVQVGGHEAGPRAAEDSPIPLSNREGEVLTHLAAGETNRQIAAELNISEHTVGRHVENIFSKLGVTSRAAATAHAYEHDLLGHHGSS